MKEINVASRLRACCCCKKMSAARQKEFTRKLKDYSEKVYADLQTAKETWIPKNIGYAFVFSDDLEAIEKFIK